jgi:hypothetical protein
LPGTADAIGDLIRQFGAIKPVAVIFFASHHHDGTRISAALREWAHGAEVVGCTTAGEFSETAYGTGGIAALALGAGKIKRCAAALATFDDGVEAGIRSATSKIATRLSVDLRELDGTRYVGIVLNEGLKGNEEEVNEVLGHIAPLLSFVGGSAGDNLELKETRVFHNGAMTNNGSALLLLESAVPFAIVKASSFEPTTRRFTITRVVGRVVYELDGKPVQEAYAAAVGAPVSALDHSVFMASPLGVMIDGQPWVRSPIAALPDGGLLFGCKILEGSELALLASANLIGDTRSCLARGRESVGGRVSGALLFNCAHRRVEIQIKQLGDPFREMLREFPNAGFHSYGESWLGHMNNTMIGLLFG